MYIDIKRRSNRANESIIIFEFLTQKEADEFFIGMKKFLENDDVLPDLKEMMEESLERLESRYDDKYANSTCEMSSFLFQDEFKSFLLPLMIHESIKY